MNKLTIAKYKDGYIRISEYNRSIHKKGEIFCPFCHPPLEVTGVQNDFFRALPDRGRHNCGRLVPEYFNPDWKGRHLVETLSGEEGKIEVVIDINHLNLMGKKLGKIKKPRKPTETSSQYEVDNYNKYTEYKNVLRDIIRTVTQMKNFIEKNSIDNLKKIKFKYKMGTEELGINEVVKLIYELNTSLHQKDRFVISQVESIKIRNGSIYINAYNIEGVELVTTFAYPSNANLTGIKKDDYIIAFGTINYYSPQKKYYLNILSDLNIEKINSEKIKKLFDGKEIIKRDIVKHDTEKKLSQYNKKEYIEIKNQVPIHNVIEHEITDSVKYEEKSNITSQAIMNNETKQIAPKKNINKNTKEHNFVRKVFRGLSKLLRR